MLKAPPQGESVTFLAASVPRALTACEILKEYQSVKRWTSETKIHYYLHRN